MNQIYVTESPPKVDSKNKVKKHNLLLNELLEQVEPIDFWDLEGIEKGKNLKQKHYLIGVVEDLLSKAESNNWNMCKHNESIYLYNGNYWSCLEKDDVKRFLSNAAEKMEVDKYDAKHYSFANKLYEQFLFSANFQKPKPLKNKVLVNLKNGTFEIDKSGFRLRDFDQTDFLTYQLTFDYLPNAKCPKFLSYLNTALPDKQCQNILAEYIGYVFTRHLKLEKCLLLYGSGGNGKSVFFDIVNSLLGNENISNHSLVSLGSEYYRAQLSDKLINYGSEIAGNISVDIFKKLVSIEPVEARLPYGQPFTIRDYAKLMFNCNVLPKDVEHNEAYFRRFLIIPFDKTIPKNERNPNLAKEIIKEELPGVFNWVLEGLIRLLDNQSFTESTAVSDMISRYKKESDSVYLFLEENKFVQSEKQKKTLHFIYREYHSFCRDCGYSPLNRKNFKERIIRLGFEVKRTNIGVSVFYEKEA